MLENVFYGSFFLAAVPRLDTGKSLPRFEVLIPSPTREEEEGPWEAARPHVRRLLGALRQTGFDVSAEHRMYESRAKLDVLPTMIIKVHDTVKHWAADLLSRVREFIDRYLARHMQSKKLRGIRLRPLKREELELLYAQLKEERERQAGGRGGADKMLEK